MLVVGAGADVLVDGVAPIPMQAKSMDHHTMVWQCKTFKVQAHQIETRMTNYTQTIMSSHHTCIHHTIHYPPPSLVTNRGKPARRGPRSIHRLVCFLALWHQAQQRCIPLLGHTQGGLQ